MTTRPWRAAALLAPAAIAAAALTVPAASASAASPSWQLTNEFASSPVCYTTAGGTNELEINLNGTWSTPINIGASGLPAGVSVAGTTLIDFYYYLDGSYTVAYTTPPIPAGWSRFLLLSGAGGRPPIIAGSRRRKPGQSPGGTAQSSSRRQP